MISRLASFYGEQIRVLWEWRGGRVALLKRLLITLIVATISFAATAGIMGSRFTIDRLLDAVVAVILIALFNAIVRPVVLALAAPISLILVGVLVLVLQIVAFLVVANYAPGVHVDGFLVALVASIHLRDHQHGPNGDPGHRQRRLLLRHAGPAAAGQALDGSLGQAGARDHPDRRAGAPDPRRPDARRSVNTMASLVRDGATSCRAGRRSCRR